MARPWPAVALLCFSGAAALCARPLPVARPLPAVAMSAGILDNVPCEAGPRAVEGARRLVTPSVAAFILQETNVVITWKKRHNDYEKALWAKGPGGTLQRGFAMAVAFMRGREDWQTAGAAACGSSSKAAPGDVRGADSRAESMERSPYPGRGPGGSKQTPVSWDPSRDSSKNH